MLAADDLEKAWGGQTHEVDGSQAAMLARQFAEIVAQFPVFDESNLHEFRKSIKKVRYLAEIYAADPASERIAAQMRKAQSAVGEWHDWQILARTATKGKHVEDSEAGELFGSLAAESYEAAIAVCQSMKHRMADLELHSGIDGVRKPPCAVRMPRACRSGNSADFRHWERSKPDERRRLCEAPTPHSHFCKCKHIGVAFGLFRDRDCRG